MTMKAYALTAAAGALALAGCATSTLENDFCNA